MGSYSEVVLGFSFKPNTPEYVLAAFSALEAAPRDDEDGWNYESRPPLPPPQEIDEDEVGVWEPTDWEHDLADPTPWRHDWAAWMNLSQSVHITPHAQMTWSAVGLWTVSCRWGIKAHPDNIVPVLGWLGPYLEPSRPCPTFIGTIEFEYAPRPWLLWLFEEKIYSEDLNPPFSYDY